jgi:hypothetical protein
MGFIFDIYIFQGYIEKGRFGYNGLIPSSNTSTLFYLIAVSFLYYRWRYEKKNIIPFIIVLTNLFLLGTKGGYIFLICLTFYHILTTKGKIWKLAISLGIFYWFASFIINNPLMQQGIEKFKYFYREHGLFYVLVTGRHTKLERVFSDFFEWSNPMSILFGGYNLMIYNPEMDFFTMFLVLGTIGSIIYLYLLHSTLFRPYFLKTNLFFLFFVSIYYLEAFFGGHFFRTVVNSLYLALVVLYFQQSIYKKNQAQLIDVE